MAKRPAFQHQGPSTNCVIRSAELGWVSCTAYAMAMLVDAYTDGVHRPKGCLVRRRIQPRDREGGLDLYQVANAVEREFGIVVSVRTGANAIPVETALERLANGRGFVLQGNNEAFVDKGDADHAIYVHAVRGGTPDAPTHALVFDPQRQAEAWIPWRRILDFGALLRLNPSGTRRLGPGLFYAAFQPRRPTEVELLELPVPVPDDGVELRFGAVRLRPRDRTRAHAPRGRRVNVRRTPRRLDPTRIVDTLGRGERFVAWQRTDDGAVPPGTTSGTWYGNRDGTEWVHESGLRRIGGRTATTGGSPPPAGPGATPATGPGATATGPGATATGPGATPVANDTSADPLLPGARRLRKFVANGDLAASRLDALATGSASDPTPDDPFGPFGGRPLSDAEIDALPVEEDDGP